MPQIDKKLKILIQRCLFLLPSEKEKLLAKLASFSADEKRQLVKLFEAKRKQLADFNLGCSKKMKEKYEEWEKLFQKIAKSI